MKPIEISQIAKVTPVRVDIAHTAGSNAKATLPPASAQDEAMVVRSGAAQAGPSAPVDHDRVSDIRTALRSGSYPLVPAKVADAMIAARYILTDVKKD